METDAANDNCFTVWPHSKYKEKKKKKKNCMKPDRNLKKKEEEKLLTESFQKSTCINMWWEDVVI
jgi:hypothetical protein